MECGRQERHQRQAFRREGLLGSNPYPGATEAECAELQSSLVYHTSADWDYRMRQEIDGTAPQKMKDWLKRVGGGIYCQLNGSIRKQQDGAA